VLRLGGRFSIFEPIDSYFPWDPTDLCTTPRRSPISSRRSGIETREDGPTWSRTASVSYVFGTISLDGKPDAVNSCSSM
jgi:hypothetical protein